VRAKEAAELANRAKDRFLARAQPRTAHTAHARAHDRRPPSNMIDAAADVREDMTMVKRNVELEVK
jgi:hypothetical protein